MKMYIFIPLKTVHFQTVIDTNFSGRPQGSPLRWGIRNETENDATIDIGAGKAGRCLTPEHRYLHPVRPLIP